MPLGKWFCDKLMTSIWTRVIGWVVVLPAVIIWGWWVYGAEVKARAWTLPVENAEAIKTLVEAEERHQAQYEVLKADLSYLKMIWGAAKIQTTGMDEVYAVINEDSPALRFQPGQEIWITNQPITLVQIDVMSLSQNHFPSGMAHLLIFHDRSRDLMG